MIKAEDIRIGNLAHRKGITHTIEASDLLDMDEGMVAFNGILLTEQWLVKLGFAQNELYAGHLKFIWYGEDNIGIKGMLGLIKPSSCKHVHQLQNLYFALTNQELTLNSPVRG